MKKFPTVTVAICAYNEEQNIKLLLKAIFNQQVHSGKIIEIIVFSDGSTDKTVSYCKSFKDKRLTVIESKKRKGVMVAQNEILKKTNGDILILLDADIIPIGNYFIENLIKPFFKDKNLGIVAADTISAEPSGFFEKVISNSHEYKKCIYKGIKNGNNIYLCHGRARAFSKEFYTKIRWPKLPPEDAFSYLFCIKHGFKFKFAENAEIIFRSPTTLNDHVIQSLRFFKGIENMTKYFPADFVDKSFKIPKILLLKFGLKWLFENPINMFVYFIILTYVRCIAIYRYHDVTKWKISTTTKKIGYLNA